MRQRALEEAERWMIERIGEGSDGLAAVFPAMLNSLIALRALGYPTSTRFIKRRAKDFARSLCRDPEDFRIQPCLSPVWDTAINIIALAESGLPAEHPALQKRRNGWSTRRSDSRRLDGQQSASRSERLGLRIQQRLLSGHRRHRDGADGVAAGSAERTGGAGEDLSSARSPGS